MDKSHDQLSELERLKAKYVKDRVHYAAQRRLSERPDEASTLSTPPSTHSATWIIKRLTNLLSGRVGKPKMLRDE